MGALRVAISCCVIELISNIYHFFVPTYVLGGEGLGRTSMEI